MVSGHFILAASYSAGQVTAQGFQAASNNKVNTYYGSIGKTTSNSGNNVAQCTGNMIPLYDSYGYYTGSVCRTSIETSANSQAQSTVVTGSGTARPRPYGAPPSPVQGSTYGRYYY